MKVKLFYGWYIVIAGMVLSAIYGSIFVYGWTAFVNPMLVTFGWTMTQFSMATSLRGLEAGVFNPVWGIVVDRWSAKTLMLLGIIGMSIGVFCLSQTKNLAMYYGAFLIVGLGSSLVTNVLPITVMSRWFKKDIGKANGLFWMGMAIGGVTVPLLVKVMDRLGWQTTLLYVAIGLALFSLPISLVFRSRPEDYNLLPDGTSSDSTVKSSQAKGRDFGTSVKEVFRTRAFWYLGLVNMVHSMGIGTLTLYAMPYLTGFGISRATASTVVSLYTLVSLFVRMPMGALSDIFKKSYVVALSVALQCTGLFFFALIGTGSPFWFVALFGIIYGLGLGGFSPIRAPILAEYFGTKNFGTIFGVSSIFMTVGGIIAPPVAGWVYDTYNDYKAWWVAIVALTLATLVLILIIPAPKTRPEPIPNEVVPAKTY